MAAKMGAELWMLPSKAFTETLRAIVLSTTLVRTSLMDVSIKLCSPRDSGVTRGAAMIGLARIARERRLVSIIIKLLWCIGRNDWSDCKGCTLTKVFTCVRLLLHTCKHTLDRTC